MSASLDPVGGSTPTTSLMGIVAALAIGVATAVQTTIAALAVAFVVLLATVLAVGRLRLARSLFALYLIGLLGGLRHFAEIGFHPIYLAEVLLVVTTSLTMPRWLVTIRHDNVRVFRWTMIPLSALGFVGVARGFASDFEGALKGTTLALYPLLALLIGTWLSQERDRIDRAFDWLMFVPGFGILLVAFFDLTTISSAAGLVLGVAGAIAITKKTRPAMLAMAITLFAAGLITATSAKRGMALTVLAALVMAHLASRSSNASRRTVAATSISIALLAGAVLGALISNPSRDAGSLPVVGSLIERTYSGFSSYGSEAERNVSYRWALWDTAVSRTFDDPLLGAGAGAPITIDYRGTERSRDRAGPHNSYVGYGYYLGFPAAALLIATLTAAAWRAWSNRRTVAYAPAIFGSIVAVALTALTNDAFETTYIGGPAWLTIAVAVSLPKLKDDEET